MTTVSRSSVVQAVDVHFITGPLAFRLFAALSFTTQPVQRGILVQRFVARDLWNEWNALIQHPGIDILSPSRGPVEVKYFFWHRERFSQTLRSAVRQHGGYVPLLVLVSVVLVVPEEGRTPRQPLNTMLMNSSIGVVICEMSEVTEEVSATQSWRELVREITSQLPPDHELYGLEPEEVLEHFRTQLLKQIYERQEQLEKRQEQLEKRQEQLEKVVLEQFMKVNEALESIKKMLKNP